MKIVMTIEEFKSNIVSTLPKILEEHEINISQDKRNEILVKLIPKPAQNKPKRKLGILDKKSKIGFGKDFKMSEEELLDL